MFSKEKFQNKRENSASELVTPPKKYMQCNRNRKGCEILLIRDVAVGCPEVLQVVYAEVEGILSIAFTLRDFHVLLTLEFIHSPD